MARLALLAVAKLFAGKWPMGGSGRRERSRTADRPVGTRRAPDGYGGAGPARQRLLKLFNRADCQPISATAAPVGTDLITTINAPGATVIVCTDDTGSYLDGYSPRSVGHW
ncbi:hypothetical protein BST20_17770 [Mycobacterium branderi]|uniref:Uncharacterized protein n=1 Tax=Mycobacterium branderi TaxID=43348 RepID=A0A7I7WCE2_9MYCO|nr:hypothetical protein BST20_17770 [Mycobacterium branderi]BBZ15144.1 hypothetical protein MBRA_53390 [Mycobacterium branderi]